MKKRKSIKMKIKPKVDMADVDEAVEKVKELNRLLKEANSLTDELASKTINLKIHV